MKKIKTRTWAVLLAALTCVYLGLWALPSDYLPGSDQMDTNAYCTMMVAQNGDLVGWGVNNRELLGKKNLIGDGDVGGEEDWPNWYPYIARRTILHDVARVSTNGQNCSMAVDRSGILWGWGRSRLVSSALGQDHRWSSTPDKLMEDVADVAVGQRHALALKTDGTVWSWGRGSAVALGGGAMDEEDYLLPRQVMEGVLRVYAYNDLSLAISQNYDLYIWGTNGAFPVILIPVKMAENIADVSFLNHKTCLLLSREGEACVLKLDEGRVINPIAEGVEAIYGACLKKADGSYWLYQPSEEDGGSLTTADGLEYGGMKIRDNGHFTVGGWPLASMGTLSAAYSYTFWILALVCVLGMMLSRFGFPLRKKD